MENLCRYLQITLLCLAFIPSISSASYNLPPHVFPGAREAMYWNRIDISPSYLIAQLQTKEIRSSQGEISESLLYMANINMVSALLYFCRQPYSLHIKKNSSLKNKEFGPFELTPDSDSPSPPSSLEARQYWQSSVMDFYLQQKEIAKSVLSQLFEFAMENAVLANPGRKSEIIIAGLNAWYQTIDPHSRFLPNDFINENFDPPLSPQQLIASLNIKVFDNVFGVKLAYINLSNFHSISGPLRESILKLVSRGVQGFIVDVRRNSGGPLEDLSQVLNVFLDYKEGDKFFYEAKSRDTDNKRQAIYPLKSSDRNSATQSPLIILINSNTISTAEVFAGVLQATYRAWIAGDVSFGKGTTQQPQDVLNNQAQLFETTNLLHYHNNVSPHMTGVTPDFPIATLPDARRVMNYYLNPLPFDSDHFIQSRSNEIDTLNSCADNFQNKLQPTAPLISDGDIQLERSLILMRCIVSNDSR